MITVLEILFGFLFFLAFYKSINFAITYDTIKPKADILSFKKSLAISFIFNYNASNPVNVSFLAFYPDWVKGIIYDGQPIYIEKYYPYVIPIGDLINTTSIVSINLTETINTSCVSTLILDPTDFEPIPSDYNSTTNILNFTAEPGRTYYLYCLNFTYNKYTASLVASTNITPPMRVERKYPLFYGCFMPKRAEDYVLLVDRTYSTTKPTNCQFRDDFYITNDVEVPRGFQLGNPEQLLYKYYVLLTK